MSMNMNNGWIDNSDEAKWPAVHDTCQVLIAQQDGSYLVAIGRRSESGWEVQSPLKDYLVVAHQPIVLASQPSRLPLSAHLENRYPQLRGSSLLRDLIREIDSYRRAEFPASPEDLVVLRTAASRVAGVGAHHSADALGRCLRRLEAGL